MRSEVRAEVVAKEKRVNGCVLQINYAFKFSFNFSGEKKYCQTSISFFFREENVTFCANKLYIT